MTRNYLLQLLRVYKILDSTNRLTPKYNARLLNLPDLAQHVLNATSFLRVDACYKIRLHVLLQDVQEQPVCETCGKDVNMRVTGRERYTFPKFCCNACIAKSTSVKQRRASTNMTRYGAPSILTSSVVRYSKSKSSLALNTSV
jgi:hypothetical protein